MKMSTRKALLLSWIDYESLAIELLDNYKGSMVISLENYEAKLPNYIKNLNKNFKLIVRIILKMPWNLEEKYKFILGMCKFIC